MWRAQMRWDLHPGIKLPESGEVRMADLGCGNACVPPHSLQVPARLTVFEQGRVGIVGL